MVSQLTQIFIKILFYFAVPLLINFDLFQLNESF